MSWGNSLRWTLTVTRKRSVVVALLVVAAGLAAGSMVATRSAHRAASANRADAASYCRLQAQLTTLTVVAGLSPPMSPTATVRPEAVGEIFTRMSGGVDELAEVAPSEISGDLGNVVSTLRKAAGGDAAAPRAPAFAESFRRVVADGQRCPAEPVVRIDTGTP